LAAAHKKRKRESGAEVIKTGEQQLSPADKLELWLSPWRVAGITAAVTVIYTLPLVFSFNSAVLGKFSEYYGDIFSGLWEFWVSKHQLLDLKTSPFDYQVLAGPYSSYWFSALAAHKYPVLMVPVTALFGKIASLNLFVLSGYILNAFFTYLLVRHLTRRQLPGLVSGLIVAFCPYMWARSIVHLDLAPVWPLPLLIHTLLLFDQRRTLARALLFIPAFFAFHVFCSAYYYLFIPILFGSYLLIRFIDAFVFDFSRGRAVRGAFSRITPRQWILAGVIVAALIAVAVVLYKYYLAREAAGLVRPIHWQERFKLSWANYLLPGVDHPIFGEQTRGIVPIRRNVTESTAYLGWVPLLLALWGLRRASAKWQAWMMVVIACLAISFTLGPHLSIGSLTLPMPSLLLHQFAPFIRAIGRYSIFAHLSMAVLAGYGVAELADKCRNNFNLGLLLAGIFLFGAIEYLHPLQITPIASKPENSPPIYQRIASLDPEVTIFEYPPTAVTGLALDYYIYFQTIHQKRLFNRHFNTNTIPEEYLPFWQDLDYPGAICDPNNVALLRYFGVDYVAYHDLSGTAARPLPAADLSRVQGLELVGSFDKDALYRVVAEPATVLLSFDTRPYYNYLELDREIGSMDFDPPMVFGAKADRLGWRIMRARGRLTVRNLLDKPQKVELGARAVSFVKPRKLEIAAGGGPRERIPVGTRPQQIRFGPLDLPANGKIEVIFNSPEGVSELPTSAGKIRASIALAALEATRIE